MAATSRTSTRRAAPSTRRTSKKAAEAPAVVAPDDEAVDVPLELAPSASSDSDSLSSPSSPAKDTIAMNVKDLVAQIKEAQPEALAGVPNGRAMLILREAFRIMKEELANTEDGIVSVPMLGQFRVRQVEVEKDGQTRRSRRTLFVASRPRAGEAAGAEAAH